MPDRCFLAIAATDAMVRTLRDACDTFRAESPAWRDEKWVAPELMHVTLAFFGSVPEAEMTSFVTGIERVAAGHEPFDLSLSGARAVPSRHRATMVWALLRGDLEAASALRSEVLAVSERSPETRPFQAHITLVRSRRPRRVHRDAIVAASDTLQAAGKIAGGSVSVRSLTLIASTLGSTGPTYRTLARLPLSGGRETDATD